MLIDKYPSEDVFARVPEVAAQTDPVLKQLDRLLDDDQLYRASCVLSLPKRYKWTLVHGRHSTPVEVRLAHADLQTFVSVELSRNRRASQG